MRNSPEAVDTMIILSTARLHFEFYGYAKTQMRDVSRDAAMSIELVRRYFRTKQALAEALVAECMAEVTAQVSEAAAEGRTPPDMLKAALYSLTMAAVERRWGKPRFFQIVATSTRKRWPPAVRHEEIIKAMVCRIVAAGIEAGDFTSLRSLDELCRSVHDAMQPYVNPVTVNDHIYPAIDEALLDIDALLRAMRP